MFCFVFRFSCSCFLSWIDGKVAPVGEGECFSAFILISVNFLVLVSFGVLDWSCGDHGWFNSALIHICVVDTRVNRKKEYHNIPINIPISLLNKLLNEGMPCAKKYYARMET